ANRVAESDNSGGEGTTWQYGELTKSCGAQSMRRNLSMKSLDLACKSEPLTGLRAARAVCRDLGISDTTLWRWSRRGWVRTVNICGKIYVDLQSLADFDRRAAAGEFACPPSGAALKATKARLTREGRAA